MLPSHTLDFIDNLLILILFRFLRLTAWNEFEFQFFISSKHVQPLGVFGPPSQTIDPLTAPIRPPNDIPKPLE